MYKLIFSLLSTLIFFSCTNNNNSNLKISGRIEADEINLAFKMPGKIKVINFEEGDNVKNGELIAELYSEDIKYKINQAGMDEKSSLNNIKVKKSNIEILENKLRQLIIKKNITQKNLNSQISIAENNLDKAKAYLLKVENDYKRYEKLFKEKAISEQKYEEIKTAYKLSVKDLQNAENALKVAIENKKEVDILTEEIKSLESEIRMAREDLKIAENNHMKLKEFINELQTYLNDSKIYAHSNLLILKKLSQTSEVVAAGQPIITAYDPSKIYFRGYLPEPYLGKIKIGMEGDLTIDSFENKIFKGKIVYISDKSEFTPKEVQTQGERVKQVFLIKIFVNDTENILKPGMPADFSLNIK